MLYQLLFLITSLQSTGWNNGQVHLYYDEARDQWVETIQGHEKQRFSGSVDRLVYHDSTTKSILFIAGDSEIVILSEHGGVRARIETGNIGMPRNLLVNKGSAIWESGARAMGVWKPGVEVWQWVEDARVVRFVDLRNAKVKWSRSNLEVGCPIYIGSREILSLGVKNAKDVFINGAAPNICANIIATEDGRILRRKTLKFNRRQARMIFGRVLIGTGDYLPEVARKSNDVTLVKNLFSIYAPDKAVARWNKHFFSIPLVAN